MTTCWERQVIGPMLRLAEKSASQEIGGIVVFNSNVVSFSMRAAE